MTCKKAGEDHTICASSYDAATRASGTEARQDSSKTAPVRVTLQEQTSRQESSHACNDLFKQPHNGLHLDQL